MDLIVHLRFVTKATWYNTRVQEMKSDDSEPGNVMLQDETMTRIYSDK